MLLGAIILAFFLCYKLAFGKTFKLSKEVAQLEQKAIGISELARLNLQLANRENQVDSILSSNNLKNTSIQNGLLNFLNEQKNNTSIQIVAFEEPHRFEGENGINVSYDFELTGDYNDLLKIIYGLEQEVSYGSIQSMRFEKKRDYRVRRDYLMVNIILKILESY